MSPTSIEPPGLEIRTADTDEEREAVYRFRYDVYVEEMGRYRATADHGRRRLVDPEDATQLATSTPPTAPTWSPRSASPGAATASRPARSSSTSSRPSSPRSPPSTGVGERTMISPAWRGQRRLRPLGEGSQRATTTPTTCGSCSAPASRTSSRSTASDQRPYGTRNINSAEAGYLIPLVSFPQGAEALARVRHGRPAAGDASGRPSTSDRHRHSSPLSSATDATWPRRRRSTGRAPALRLFDGLTDDEIDPMPPPQQRRRPARSATGS